MPGISTNRTNISLPTEVSSEIIQKTRESSAIMQLARQVVLPGRGLSIPVITSDPEANWVAETGKKPVSNPGLSTKTMTPYKLAVIVPFSDEFARDARGLYDALVERLPDALAKKFDRPAYFVPETVSADVLFRDMQGKKTHMALVVDEYGGTSGLVTLEDLLEELVGNIYDEFDPQEELDMIRLDDGRWRVSGSADLEELAEAIGFELPDEEEWDYDTLGGLVFSQLSVIPEDGSRPLVEALGLRIQVEELCDRRVEWALVEKLERTAAAD